MKDTTTIDGVTITRKQAEQALVEMNKPNPTYHDFKPGMVLQRTDLYSHGEKAVVVDEVTREILRKYYGCDKDSHKLWLVGFAHGEVLVVNVTDVKVL